MKVRLVESPRTVKVQPAVKSPRIHYSTENLDAQIAQAKSLAFYALQRAESAEEAGDQAQAAAWQKVSDERFAFIGELKSFAL